MASCIVSSFPNLKGGERLQLVLTQRRATHIRLGERLLVTHLLSTVSTGGYADVLFCDIETMRHARPLYEAKGPGAVLVAE